MKTILIFLVLAGLSVSTSSYTELKKPKAIAKELVFPIAGKSNIGSYWGAERDGGKRKHEGIDIFAAKETPVVAISDGVIEYVGNDNIGGKTITLQPDDYEWEAYYAHLDKQFVINGQHVKKGQLIGTVGNTGNAKTTPAHLHFGIYTDNGAIDPLPYIQTSPKITTPVKGEPPTTNRTQKSTETKAAKKNNKNKHLEIEVKTAAVKVITGELLRRIKINPF
ncbi:MAG: M23 family metallopeptidase [Ferruginibacter sp.]